MKEYAQFPFEKYVINKYWHKTEGRWFVNLLPIEGRVAGNVKTMTFVRYIMQISLGRILNHNEQVDHINNDKSDDSVNNLQILTSSENSKKYRNYKNICSEQINLTCPICNTQFSRRKTSVEHLLRNNKVLTCSRKCGYVKAKQTQNKNAKTNTSPQIISFNAPIA